MPTQREESDSEGEQEDYEEEEEVSDDEDDDDEDDQEEFEDETDEKEPMYDPNDPYDEHEPTKGASSTRLSEQENDSWRDRNRGPLIACICCCLCLIIVAVLLGILLPRHLEDDGDSSSPATIDVPTEAPNQAPFNPISFPTPPPAELKPSARTPTEFPTISPAPSVAPVIEPTPKPTDYPTIAPTVSPAPTKSIPEQLGIIADQDTTVYLDGFFVGESYGRDATFLVQRGPDAVQEVPTAVGLLTFPLDDVPAFDRLGSTKKNAVLRLNHEPNDASRGSATYTVVRMPGTPMKVEFLHGYIFVPPEGDEEGVVVGPEFTVNPDTTVVDVDVTSLLFDSEDDHQLYLMIQDKGPEQPEGGDRFYSREHPDLKPQLLIDFQGGNAADIVVDTTQPTADEGSGGEGEVIPTEAPIGGNETSDEVAPTEPPEEGETGELAPTEPPRVGTGTSGNNTDAPTVVTNSSYVVGNETETDENDTNTTASVFNETGEETVTEAPTPAVRRRWK
jgi:hypothetical protein